MTFFPDSRAQDPAIAAKLQELFGFVPRVFQIESAIPEIAKAQVGVLNALLGNEEHLSRSQKERVLLAVSAANRCSYGVALHEQMLSLLGVPERERVGIIGGVIPDGPDGELIAFARRLTTQSAEFRQDDVSRLMRLGFTKGQIVEAVILTGFCNLMNTVQFGFGAAPDFAARPIPEPQQNIVHPPPEEHRPIIEDVDDDPDANEVVRAQNGDLAAFETLVTRHSQRVYRTLIGLLGNPEDARDGVQDTFLKAYQSLGRFERRSRFSTWLVSIASNAGLQRLRERKQIESLDEGGSDDEVRPRQIRAWGDDPEQAFLKEQRRELVERAISRLPAKYRVVLMLRDVQQVSTEEASAALGLSIPALKARLLRGRLMLREALAPHFSKGAQGA